MLKHLLWDSQIIGASSGSTGSGILCWPRCRISNSPVWALYLVVLISFDNLEQEELEEGNETTIYDDYKFVTREDLERLNMTNLLGTNLLRAYMHGFFVDHRLYAKVFLYTSDLLSSSTFCYKRFNKE